MNIFTSYVMNVHAKESFSCILSMAQNVKKCKAGSEILKRRTYFYMNKFYTIWSWFDFCENL